MDERIDNESQGVVSLVPVETASTGLSIALVPVVAVGVLLCDQLKARRHLGKSAGIAAAAMRP